MKTAPVAIGTIGANGLSLLGPDFALARVLAPRAIRLGGGRGQAPPGRAS
jgi:hypothetical protein